METKGFESQAQKLNFFSNARLLNLVDFPIYYLECISERHFIIAGGGGSAKTGIHNQINIFEFSPNDDSCVAKLVHKYITPSDIADAIMNGCLLKDKAPIHPQVATSGSNIVIYTMEYNPSISSFSVIGYDKLQDPNVKAEIKRVKYLRGSIVAGSIDGQLSLWRPSKERQMTVVKHIPAHSKPIDDLDVDIINNFIVTVAREEGRCVIWDAKNLKQVREFKKELINTDGKYIFRAARFAVANEQTPVKQKQSSTTSSILLVACNAISKDNSCKICKWSSKDDWSKCQTLAIPVDGIMAITISNDARHVAIGSRSGSVMVYNVNSLSNIYRIQEAHHNAITSLEFLPSTKESLNLTGSQLCPLISVSIDRRIVLHRPKSTPIFMIFKITLLMILVLFIFMFIMQQLSQ